MNKLQQLFIGVAALGLAGAANAVPNYSAVQAVLDDITTIPLGASSVVAATDELVSDAKWAIGGSGGSVSTIVVELAGNLNSNTFGIYSGGNYVELFSGPQGAGDQALVSILSTGEVEVNFDSTGIFFAGNQFGFYLFDGDTGLYHSDTADNADATDHMLAYQGVGDTIQISNLAAGVWGSNEYILFWDDQEFAGDEDYNDFVVLVESVTPVPEPSVLALLGAGLLGLGFSRRRT